MKHPLRYPLLFAIVIALAALVSVTAEEGATSVLAEIVGAQEAVDPAWKTVAASGAVEALGSDGPDVAGEAWFHVRRGTELQPSTEVRTGRRGRATLTRRTDLLIVDPGSRLTLPQALDTDTAVVQTQGSVVYEIDRRQQRDFKVVTPYLIAGVKGTVFMVTVQEGSASVTVERGVVEIVSVSSGEVTDLHAGQTVLVDGQDERGLDVMTRKRDAGAGEPADKEKQKEAQRYARAESRRLLRVMERGQEDLLIAAELGELAPDDPLLETRFTSGTSADIMGDNVLEGTVTQEDEEKLRALDDADVKSIDPNDPGSQGPGPIVPGPTIDPNDPGSGAEKQQIQQDATRDPS